MKRFYTIVVATMMAALSLSAQEEYETYMTAEELPNAVLFLPAPPDTTSTQFVYDITQYMWGKQQRLDTDRLEMAISHVVKDPKRMAALFSEPFGMTISEEETPAIYRLVHMSVPTLRLTASFPKARYSRKRPYVRFNETTPYPDDEEIERNAGSYPSGHTVRGWGLALLLAEVNPENQNDILKLGYEWGQSRVILGYHWQSDVDASRMLAAACVATLHSNTEFLADLAAAKEEYARLTGQSTGVNVITHPASAASNRTYQINGTPADENTKGIVIQGNQKKLVR